VPFTGRKSLPIISSRTLARYGQRYWSNLQTQAVDLETEDYADLVAQVDKLKSLDIGEITKISLRNSVTKTGESRYQTIEIGPKEKKVKVLSVAPQAEFKINKIQAAPEKKPDGWKVGVFLPDMQIGFFDNGSKEYSETHDEEAIDVAHQIVSYLDSKYGVDIVVNAGDNLDFPAFSSHRSAPGFTTTTQLAINRASAEAAAQRAIAPDARIVWLCGNHDARITNYLVDKASALVGLCRADEDIPVLSIPNLCRFEEYGIEFLEPYPDAELWINDHLRFEHGGVYSSTPGGTAAKQLRNGVSVGYGHIHRSEVLQETRHTAKGPRTHFAGSPGTLCRIDGSVPSAKTGITAAGTQAASRHENWQQGIWVFWYQPDGDQKVAIEPVSIWGGWAIYRGVEFQAGV
jgi:ribosomal protein S30